MQSNKKVTCVLCTCFYLHELHYSISNIMEDYMTFSSKALGQSINIPKENFYNLSQLAETNSSQQRTLCFFTATAAVMWYKERERVVLLNKHSQQAVAMEVVGNKCTGTIAVYIYSLCRWKCRNLNLALKIHAILKKAHHLNVVSRGPPLFFFSSFTAALVASNHCAIIYSIYTQALQLKLSQKHSHR